LVGKIVVDFYWNNIGGNRGGICLNGFGLWEVFLRGGGSGGDFLLQNVQLFFGGEEFVVLEHSPGGKTDQQADGGSDKSDHPFGHDKHLRKFPLIIQTKYETSRIKD